MADRRWKTDDQELFADWIREHGQAVRGFLLASTGRADVADDLCQDVFCRAWQARRRYHEQGSARAYLLRIADRLVCDRGRRSGVEVNINEEGWRLNEPSDSTFEPSQRLALAEAKEKLTAALDQLSPVQQRVLLLRYYGQFGFAEIAEMIGCPLNTTLSHCHRGLERLRTLLAEKVP
jgi:RNA polymerase sigma-70 factor, ECF subfamily